MSTASPGLSSAAPIAAAPTTEQATTTPAITAVTMSDPVASASGHSEVTRHEGVYRPDGVLIGCSCGWEGADIERHVIDTMGPSPW